MSNGRIKALDHLVTVERASILASRFLNPDV